MCQAGGDTIRYAGGQALADKIWLAGAKNTGTGLDVRRSMSSNATDLCERLGDLIGAHHDFGKLILDLTLPPAGPYALFYHHGLLVERLENLQILIGRIGKARYRSTELAYREDRYRSLKADLGCSDSKRLSALLRESAELTKQMCLDAESLYIFANLTLDQWSFVLAYSLGLAEPTKYRYAFLVDQLQGATTPAKWHRFRDAHLTDAIWLLHQVRSHRNAFIEHVERPWQRGSTMGVYGEDFNFFITTPVGWLTPDEEKRVIDEIRQFAPQWVKDLPADHWQAQPRAVLEATYREIDRVPTQADREKIWKVWRQIGGSTVSFDQIADRLVSFLAATANMVREEVMAHPESINLGKPTHMTG